MKERWKTIPGYEGEYEVSDLGRVRSLARVVMRSNGVPQTIASRILKPGRRTSGHLTVSLRRRNSIGVHILVLRAFRGPALGGQEALHLDHTPSNNRLNNLKWGSRGENLIMDYTDGSRSSIAHPVRVHYVDGSSKDFATISQAASALNAHATGIRAAMRNFSPLRYSKNMIESLKDAS